MFGVSREGMKYRVLVKMKIEISSQWLNGETFLSPHEVMLVGKGPKFLMLMF